MRGEFGATGGSGNENEAHDRASRRSPRRRGGRICGERARAQRRPSTITIWADNDRKAAVTQLANQWAQARGATANVVVHDFGKIRDDLGTVAAGEAPDVIMGAHDWTGQLAANGLVQPLVPERGDEGAVPRVHARTRSRTAPP